MKATRKQEKMVLAIHQVSFHRNGISGAGFHAVLFDSLDEAGVRPIRMVGIVFAERGHCAVLATDRLGEGGVGVVFGENSWRGDQFEPELREAIATHLSLGSTKMGPFGIPSWDTLAKHMPEE